MRPYLTNMCTLTTEYCFFSGTFPFLLGMNNAKMEHIKRKGGQLYLL